MTFENGKVFPRHDSISVHQPQFTITKLITNEQFGALRYDFTQGMILQQTNYDRPEKPS